jgi:hypothetical protein
VASDDGALVGGRLEEPDGRRVPRRGHSRLFRLALLVDDYWQGAPSGRQRRLAAEIRLQGQLFGLSPIDRRRLQWQVEQVEERRAKRPQASASSDGSRTSGRCHRLRVRGLERVRLHADLTIRAKLACALSRARMAPLAV